MTRPVTIVAAYAEYRALHAATAAIAGNPGVRSEILLPHPGDRPELGEKRDTTRLMLAAFLVGGACLFLLQVHGGVIDYPLNAGGRPLFAWGAFLVGSVCAGLVAAVLLGWVRLLSVGSGAGLGDRATEALAAGYFVIVAEAAVAEADDLARRLRATAALGVWRGDTPR